MNKNVGGMDRIIRLAAGVLLIVWAALLNGPLWAWVGVIPLFTGGVGFCPLYSLAGFNTCSKK